MKKQIVLLILTVVLVNCGWLQAGLTANPMDFNNDKKVDVLDFAEFASNWLWEAPAEPNEFAYIPGGTFEMGDHHDGMSASLPVHTIILDSFYIGKYEITNQKYCDYLNDANSLGLIKVDGDVVYASDDTSNSFPYCDTSTASWSSQIDYSMGVFSVKLKDGVLDMSNHPMLMVSWYGAAAYCNWRSQQKGLESCYNLSTWQCDFTKDGYHLPTDAQWEYAARGGEHSPYYRFPWGDTIDPNKANYWESGDPYEIGATPWTTPVGYYDGNQIPAGTDMANGYGLYDMVGNVWEFCNDWYSTTYYQQCDNNGTVHNPTGPASGSFCVYRCGFWAAFEWRSRVAYRGGNPRTNRYNYLGFRVCR